MYYIILGIVLIFLEIQYLKKFNTIQKKYLKRELVLLLNPNKIFGMIMLLSLIPIGIQIYMIIYFGGIEKYLISMVFRVEEWQGLMFLLGLKDIYPVLNLIFLLFIVTFKIENKSRWIFIFSLHLFIAIILGLLTGSRSWVLNIFLCSIIVLNYIKFKIKPKYLIFPFFFFLIGMEVLSTIRSKADKVFEDSSALNEEESIIARINKSATFTYGLHPLVYINEKNFTDFRYGVTYLTTFTNYIPRKIWPSKPESAGTVLTKFNEGANYSNLSAESPGLIVEAIINFGYVFSYPFVFFFFIALAMLTFYTYQYMYKYMDLVLAYGLKIYYRKFWMGLLLVVSITQMMGALTFAESTNVFFNLIKSIVFSFFILKILFGIVKLKTNE